MNGENYKTIYVYSPLNSRSGEGEMAIAIN